MSFRLSVYRLSILVYLFYSFSPVFLSFGLSLLENQATSEVLLEPRSIGLSARRPGVVRLA